MVTKIYYEIFYLIRWNNIDTFEIILQIVEC